MSEEMSPEVAEALVDFATADARLRGITPPAGEWIAPPSPEHHPCVLPALSYAEAGRPWKCGECGAVWTLYRHHDTLEKDLLNDPAIFGIKTPPDTSWVQMEDQRGRVIPSPPSEDRYAINLEAPKAPPPVPAGDNVSPLNAHALTCAHRAGTGMCSCEQRKNI